MKKSFKYFLIIWIIAVAVFNMICFMTPNEAGGYSKFGGAFWPGYVFIMLAFAGHLACAYFALRERNAQKVFYRIPMITISYFTLVLMLIVGVIAMAVPNLPCWIGAVVCLLILTFEAFAVLKASANAEMIEAIDQKVESRTMFIKTLTVEANKILERASTPEMKSECKKVYEAVKFSDPMSSDKLTGVEESISLKLEELAVATDGGDAESVKNVANDLLLLIKERNDKCRITK